jgi:hypothetical protein
MSTIHASVTTVFGIYALLYLNNMTQNEIILMYQVIIGYSLGYAINDMVYVLNSVNKSGKGYSMILHHIIGLLLGLFGFSCLIYRYDETPWEKIMASLYLAEASTPILNYIQYNYGNVNSIIRFAFAIIFFLCRVVNMTLVCLFTPYGPFYIVLCGLTLLNYFWFMKIAQKIIKYMYKSV